MTALIAWPRFHSPRAEPQGDNQMAAPAEPRTPNLHRAKIAPRECEWKHGDSGHSAGENLGLRKKIHLTPTGLLMEGDYTQNDPSGRGRIPPGSKLVKWRCYANHEETLVRTLMFVGEFSGTRNAS